MIEGGNYDIRVLGRVAQKDPICGSNICRFEQMHPNICTSNKLDFECYAPVAGIPDLLYSCALNIPSSIAKFSKLVSSVNGWLGQIQMLF